MAIYLVAVAVERVMLPLDPKYEKDNIEKNCFNSYLFMICKSRVLLS